MVLLNSQGQPKSSFCYQESLLENLSTDELTSFDTAVQLSSGDDKVHIHTSILVQASKLVKSVIGVGESCICHWNPTIILPLSPPRTLNKLATLLYTGQVPKLSEAQARHIAVLARHLGMNTSIALEKADSMSDESSLDQPEHGNSEDKASMQNHSELISSPLNLEIALSDDVLLSFPKSRIKRDVSKNIKTEYLSGFHRRVQKEYNRHPVGQYMGPYDQNESLQLSIQLPNTSLEFPSYTQFHHSGDQCFEYTVKEYEKYETNNKIGSYQIKSTIESRESDDSDSDDSCKSDKQTKLYTCQIGKCKIPCPCPQCCSNKSQCTKHKIMHIDLFNEREHSISIRSSSEFCMDEEFFNHSYIVKYPGIPLVCKKCHQDLFYHFEFHDDCRFCMQIFYKLRATTEKEFYMYEKKETQYYETVCPFCDKRFCDAFEAKRHIKAKHKDPCFPYKCDQCEKGFLSLKAKQYHDETKHSNVHLPVSCDVCDKTFSSKVNLKSHKRYVHSDLRKWSCSDCEAKFKQKRDWRVHMMKFHDLDMMKEDYHEKQEEILLKCEYCDRIFKYKKNLNEHMRTKHSSEKKVFKCEECSSTFKENRSLLHHQTA